MTPADLSGRRFLGVTILNVVITVFELLGGLLSGSLALLSDAIHNLGDAFSVVLSYFANRLGRRTQTPGNTFGFRRAEILAALLNAGLLIVISVGLVGEALDRLWHPTPVSGQLMLLVAVISLGANLLSTGLLHRGAAHNLNLKATYLHLLSDALASVGVIVGAVVITVLHWTWVDPILTMIVAVYISYESWPIIKQTVLILMEGAPALDYTGIQRDILAIPEVTGVHHVHAWLVDEHQIAFSLHVNMADLRLSQVEPIYRQIEQLLCERYGIGHVTIQAERQRGQSETLFYEDNDWHQNNA